MPNSARIVSVTAPDDCSPAASSSRMRRRTGSPRTSNARTAATVSAVAYISAIGYRRSLPVERDLDLDAARQSRGGLRHDDVAVGAGEDGEQRRRAEERGGDTLREGHLNDVEAARGGGKVAGQPGADRRLRRRAGAPADEPDQRHPDEAEDDEGGSRVARQPDHRDPAALREEGGLARPEREPVAPDAGLAERGDSGGGLVAGADGRSGGDDEEVAPIRERAAQRRLQRVALVRHDSGEARLAPGLAHQCRQSRRWRVADLAGLHLGGLRRQQPLP